MSDVLDAEGEIATKYAARNLQYGLLGETIRAQGRP
jgi:hypothetical protein